MKAFIEGFEDDPPEWYIKRYLGRIWNRPPWEVGSIPGSGIWAIREMKAAALEWRHAQANR